MPRYSTVSWFWTRCMCRYSEINGALPKRYLKKTSPLLFTAALFTLTAAMIPCPPFRSVSSTRRPTSAGTCLPTSSPDMTITKRPSNKSSCRTDRSEEKLRTELVRIPSLSPADWSSWWPGARMMFADAFACKVAVLFMCLAVGYSLPSDGPSMHFGAKNVRQSRGGGPLVERLRWGPCLSASNRHDAWSDRPWSVFSCRIGGCGSIFNLVFLVDWFFSIATTCILILSHSRHGYPRSNNPNVTCHAAFTCMAWVSFWATCTHTRSTQYVFIIICFL